MEGIVVDSIPVVDMLVVEGTLAAESMPAEESMRVATVGHREVEQAGACSTSYHGAPPIATSPCAGQRSTTACTHHQR